MVRIRVVIAAEPALLRRGVASLLAAASGIDVVGEASDGPHACAAALELRPDVVLIDAALTPSATEVARRIHAELPGTRLVVLAGSASERAVAAATGAEDCVAKSAEPRKLVEAIHSVASGSARQP